MKILITGAHFTPAVAVIEELKKTQGVEIVYVGRRTTLEGDSTPSQESRVIPSLGVKFIPIITGRLQRSFTIYTITSILKIPIGFMQSFWIVLKEKPDVILSFGGYVGLPLVLIGWLFSIPTMIHEQTLVSGLANKISSIFADKIALSFNNPQMVRKKIFTGNPLRKEIINPSQTVPSDYQKLFLIAKKEKLPVIVVMGGNQGSHTINKIIEEILEKLLKLACIIHVSGDNKFKDFENLEKLQNEKYLVKKWIGKEYGMILSKVDLVISRAGANTLTELAYMGKPALVIPFEPLYQDEQNKNAKYFEKLGFVRILPQSKLSSNSLLENVKNIIKYLSELKEKAKGAKIAVIPDSSKRLALETLLLEDQSKR